MILPHSDRNKLNPTPSTTHHAVGGRETVSLDVDGLDHRLGLNIPDLLEGRNRLPVEAKGRGAAEGGEEERRLHGSSRVCCSGWRRCQRRRSADLGARADGALPRRYP